MKIQLVEPTWGKEFLIQANKFFGLDSIQWLVPILADGVVLLYPFLLIWLYYKWGLHNKEYKKAALMIFFSVGVAIGITLLIQQFVSKSRPEDFLDTNLILLDHLPSISFPSDHATVGFALAFGLLFAGKKLKDDLIWIIGWVFLILAVFMGLARIWAGVHWPTDILAGLMVAALGVWLVFKYENIWTKPVNFLIWLEEQTLGRFFEKFKKKLN